MIHDLPWLMRPTPADRAELGGITGTGGMKDVASLRAIADRGWNDGELRSIGRKLRKSLQSVEGDWRQHANKAGCTPFSLLIVSSRTVNHLTDALCAAALLSGILLSCRVVEYEEPESWLSGSEASLTTDPPDATLLAIDRKALHLQATAGDVVSADECIQAALDRVHRIATETGRITGRAVIIETLAAEASDTQLSMDAWLPGAPRRLISEFNRRLADLARKTSNVIFDVAGIAELVGLSAWSAGRYWYVAKLPFAPAYIPLYAQRLLRLIGAMIGKSRRVLVLDLDNTLWGGVIGDDGIGGIVIGAGSARGEAHLAIQRMALQYKERGIILCIASKNTDEVAREVFRRHPEMLIKEDDIALFQINWNDKASNIQAIADALDLGLDAFVFLDDNPVERKQVRDTLPMIAVPELPEDPSDWVPVIEAAAHFEQLSFTLEDQARTEYYKANARRTVQAQTIGDPRKFLESLQMTMIVAPFDALGRGRIVQLIAKSNQFNLTTRRYSESEVAAFEEAADCEALQIRLKDMFGDNGMISVVICTKHRLVWEIDTWIMSCRVLGRGVERAVLGILGARARAGGARELQGIYIPTAKNGLVRDHYAKLGFTKIAETERGETTWKLLLESFVPDDLPIKTLEFPSQPFENEQHRDEHGN